MENRTINGVEIIRFNDEGFWYVTVDGAVLRKWNTLKYAKAYAKKVSEAVNPNDVRVTDYQTEASAK